ncbi:hypothetical protein RHSIM_Rhsim10G0044300 [Rhododendron simsii]|uniref:U1-type domain-containing protein n=1 Tax=Rhododendron simsii TaxID=118357 RepID=A0A834LC22_RHOSS|nr:hypothetical protein RHSIM_Rhsim10G0044300 [Rhododendron simsii]
MADNTPPPPQNPNQPPPQHPHHQIYTPATPSPYYLPHQHSQNPNPEQPNSHPPQLDPLDKTHDPIAALTPPGMDPTSSSAGGVHEAYDPSALCDQSAYFQDPNVANSLKNWALDVLRYYGSNPNATGVTMPPINATFRPHGNSTRKESAKKTKVVQSVWCEVCRVECNTKEVLDKHKMGKKHKKNEDKLKESTAPHPPAASGVSDNPVIGPQENPASSSVQKTRKKVAEPEEDLETKRRKIMNEGAASDAVRVCTICNVVCNSELVFAYHNAGKKHAAMMTKQSVSGTGVTTAT